MARNKWMQVQNPNRFSLKGCETVNKKRNHNYAIPFIFFSFKNNCSLICRGDWIRTSDHQHPMLVRYRTALHPDELVIG